MRFKIDENLPVEAADLLQAAGHEATTIHDEHLVGQPDPNVAQVCRDECRALVTLDLDFSDIRTYPSMRHGIPGWPTIDRVWYRRPKASAREACGGASADSTRANRRRTCCVNFRG